MNEKQQRGRALVTGGSRGIGRAVALALLKEGYSVTITGTRKAGPDIEELTELGLRYLHSDVANTADHARVIGESRPDLLVNNAGMAPRARADLLDMGEASLREVLDVNLIGPMLLTQRAARGMAERGRGMIVNIASCSSDTVSINRGEYCVSKAGVSMMTRLFAVRLAPLGIPVYELRPGIIATDMTGGVKEKYDALIAGGLLPMPRWGTPEDVAKAVVLLAGGGLSYSTGDIINIDGGMHIKRL